MQLARPNACVKPVKTPIIIADEQHAPLSHFDIDMLLSELEHLDAPGDAHE